MRIGIIGTGISGLVAAYRLCDTHDVTLFEANDYVGGHTNTASVQLDGENHNVDTGFIVFNDRTYPNFCRLLRELEVTSHPTTMSFSVRCDRSRIEYNGTSLNGLFAQRMNLIRPTFHRMIRDILRFNREAVRLLDRDGQDITVGEFLLTNRYSDVFANRYLLPMGSAIWSCPSTAFEQFPIRFIAEFYKNHGLLGLRNRPVWRVIQGGSRRYVSAMTARLGDRIRLNSPVESVLRLPGCVMLKSQGHPAETYDEVIFACHSDQSLAILGNDATSTERQVLSQFPYQPNTAVLHTDTSLLPRRKRAWASWNYHIPETRLQHATVTYNMNRLQHIRSKNVFCVTLNECDAIDERKVIRRFQYSHPVYTIQRAQAQNRHTELIRANRTSFCGAYWGNGFHEDGVNSALAVVSAYGRPSAARREEVASHA
ncbi:MAG: FAD-dependent oxidoreductase [Planctomycetes bacterium]|nr:FAD-dependent oxidoreductase [Planctomycetota bacterium]MBL7040489.1 FAD-dependent oxidoreductase [Pirellulaceae bacterium]